MTTRPHDDPRDALRDPAVDAAWRAASREAPPPALDAAILAAARRAAHAGPLRPRAANRYGRWWWPLAAAATLGAVAVGILQLAEPDKIVAPSAGPAALTDMPPAVPTAPTPQGAAGGPAAAPAAPSASHRAQRMLPQAAKVAPAAPAALAPEPARERAADDTRFRTGQAATSEAVAAKPANAAPQKFAAPPAEQRPQAADESAQGARPAPASPERGALAPAPPASPYPAGAARSDAAGRDGQPALRKSAAQAASGAGGAASPVAAAPPVAEWIALIRDLRTQGHAAEAARELAAFRAAHADAQQLLPPDLRDWHPAAD
jgi:hypothetical protein